MIDLASYGITYIICKWCGLEQRWGMSAHPTKDTISTLKAHLKKHAPSAEFIRAEYHDENGFVFEYGDEPNENFEREESK